MTHCPYPTIIDASAIHPCQVIVAVSAKPLPIEQPPATDAPNPIHMPPIALFRIVILSGNRHLNSLDPLAAIYEPMKIPRTKRHPNQ